MLLTRPPLRILIKNQNSPFDLHVLSVPPAFVLSQDQTLYYSCISIALPNALKSILLHNACVITFRVYFFQSVLDFLFPSNLHSKESQGSLLFLALFDFQDAVRLLPLSEQLYYYITAF